MDHLTIWISTSPEVNGTSSQSTGQCHAVAETPSGFRRLHHPHSEPAAPPTVNKVLSVGKSTAPGTSSSTARRTAAPTAQQFRRTRTTRAVTSSSTTPRGGATAPPRGARSLCYCCLDPIPPTGWGGQKTSKNNSKISVRMYRPHRMAPPHMHHKSDVSKLISEN